MVCRIATHRVNAGDVSSRARWAQPSFSAKERGAHENSSARPDVAVSKDRRQVLPTQAA